LAAKAAAEQTPAAGFLQQSRFASKTQFSPAAEMIGLTARALLVLFSRPP
jgi:hypothetical protein